MDFIRSFVDPHAPAIEERQADGTSSALTLTIDSLPRAMHSSKVLPFMHVLNSTAEIKHALLLIRLNFTQMHVPLKA
jgi:hypothetical protein